MSCDYYFKKWKSTLKRLESLVQFDHELQAEKAHDQLLNDAVQRVNTVLVRYMTVYNEAMDCVQNNLQVQKATYMDNIVEAIASRILELKRDLEDLEVSPFPFVGTALIINNQTYDPEMTTILKAKRPQIIQEAIENAFLRVKEKREAPEEPEEPEVVEGAMEEESSNENIEDIFLKLEEMRKTYMMAMNEDEDELVDEQDDGLTEEERIRRDYVNLIKAHEKLRQVTRSIQLQKYKREAWERELLGIARPPARYELRLKAAKLIQRIIRKYLEIKRKRIRECKLDQKLGIAICKHPIIKQPMKIEKKLENRTKLYEQYEKECMSHKENITKLYMKNKSGEMSEDFRDRIRAWFYEWFESVRFIHKIPKEGSIAIFMEEVPDPYEWLKEYEASANKKDKEEKSLQQLKYDKQAAKELERQLKKEKLLRQKEEAALLKKMMKFPKNHPGYFYKQSKKTDDLLEIINSYHKTWDDYDDQEIQEAKRKYIDQLNKEDVYMNVKLEILESVNDDMQTEYTALYNALKKDYQRNEQVMPKQAAEPKRKKKRKRVKAVKSERIVDKLEALAMQGFIVEYPETKLDDYFGDPNFIGDDLRRSILPAFPQSYEVRAHWWDRCHKVTHGSQKLLLVGPEDSGKITLVYALASMNDAMLFEMDPLNFPKELLTAPQLRQLTNNVLFCAKAVQPSVIYTRHLQKLFYTKEPVEEAQLQLGLIKRYFLTKLLKKITRQDKITIIGTCSDPWLTRSKQLLKSFPIVILLPNVTYPLAVLILKNWVDRVAVLLNGHRGVVIRSMAVPLLTEGMFGTLISLFGIYLPSSRIGSLHLKWNLYPSIPSNFEVSSLAYVLKKHSYGFITKTLKEFMSDDRLVRIAAHGLTPLDVYNYILENELKETIEYDRYLKWYFEKTKTGRKEKEHMNDQIVFREAVAVLKAKEEKQARMARRSAPSSMASSRTNL